ncbi:iron complex outermembrane receptor protein [Dyadobacter jejuensis]|uniref:Iron complex outermembrane receptor protein n=1 Tax=Dyadobacter jejuensis TaxID=1082580 RepID=A0A316AM76_9BACT|nr:TonB-dependent receptor [Dyadobacter jejuensis]PWJ58671.1 iron complex outermembrane receptor protein [Dyadobacter jejuensis]
MHILNLPRINQIAVGILILLALLNTQAWAQQNGSILGKVASENGEPLVQVHISIANTGQGTTTDASGRFHLSGLPSGAVTLRFSLLGFQTKEETIELGSNENRRIKVILKDQTNELQTVEVFGDRNKQPDKLEAITRLPLKPSDQIQSISVISDRLIEKQGALSVIEGVRNIPGVYTYSTYGGVKESISARGFRGIPTLKNGVRVMTDFRGMGYPTDMQGVESIQVMKGSASVTQGLGQASGQATDLGAPGGIVNVVTKTPKFETEGAVSVRGGSFNLFRPTFDFQGLLNESKTIAFRINGAYQTGGKFRKGMQKESFYINPSLAFRPNEQTTITLEMDYYNVNESIDAGTVNMAVDPNPNFDPTLPVSSSNLQYLTNRRNEIYDIPDDRMLGFKSDLSITKHSTFTARFKRYLDPAQKLYVRGAVYRSNFDADAIRTSLTPVASSPGVNDQQLHLYTRSISHSLPRIDKNTVVQFDLVGESLQTGILKHTFMVGVDYKITDLTQASYNTISIPGVIDIFDPESISNTLPYGTANFTSTGETISKTTNMGLTAQDVITLADRVKLFAGLRYSTNQSNDPLSSAFTRTNFWNPIVGMMVSVKKGLNVFASYTNSTRPENVSQIDANGNTFGNGFVNQLEAGIKSDWLNNRLRFNLTLYRIEQSNIIEQLYDINNAPITIEGRNVYRANGDDRRQGVEIELTGRILENLETILGYSYIDASYRNTEVNVEGSAPNNTPHHTFNGWVNYTVREGKLAHLNFGAGVYYLGSRPYNDWTQAGYTTHGVDTSNKPWLNKAYTLVNAQIGYQINKNWGVRCLANNIFNKVGYDAYRTSFIDKIQPRNVSGVLTYRF